MKKINVKRLVIGIIFIGALMLAFWFINRQIQIREIYVDMVKSYGKERIKTEEVVRKTYEFRVSQVKSFINIFDTLKHLLISSLLSYGIFKERK